MKWDNDFRPGDHVIIDDLGSSVIYTGADMIFGLRLDQVQRLAENLHCLDITIEKLNETLGKTNANND